MIAWTVGTAADRLAIFLALTDAQRRLVKTALEVRSAGLRQGEYPTELPADAAGRTADPLTHRPLSYARAAEGSALVKLEITPDLRPFVGTPRPAQVVLPPLH